MKPLDLVKSARLLVNTGKGKPSQVNLRRSVSSAYYALFHCLARTSADLLVGGSGSARSMSAWRQVYRALEHNSTKNACKDNTVQKFPKPIEDFANTFITMQDRRHAADYDPFAILSKSEVLQYISTVDAAIRHFSDAPIKDKRAFCAFVLFKKRL